MRKKIQTKEEMKQYTGYSAMGLPDILPYIILGLIALGIIVLIKITFK